MKNDDDAAVELLHHYIATKGVTIPMQDFANKVLQHYIVKSGSDTTVSLKQLCGKSLRFKKIKTIRALKATTKARSCRMWMNNLLSGLLDDAGPYGQEVVVELLRTLAKMQGMVFGNRSDFQLSVSVAQSVVMCDHIGTGTNGT